MDRTDPEAMFNFEVGFQVTKKEPAGYHQPLPCGARNQDHQRDAGPHQGAGVQILHHQRHYRGRVRRGHPALKARAPGRGRRAGVQGDQAVQPRPDLQRGALQQRDPDLAGDHRQGVEGIGRQPGGPQPHLHDGGFRRPRLHEPDQAAGRHARPAGQHRRQDH